MKDIDLLPGWYKSSRKKRKLLRAQYAVLAIFVLFMTLWTVLMSNSVKKAQAGLVALEAKRSSVEKNVKDYSGLSGRLEQLKQNKALIAKCASNIDLSSSLAELSFLLDENIVISKLYFSADKLDAAKRKTQIKSAAQVYRSDSLTLSGPVGFKVSLTGFADDSGKVADLICRLEDSPYFSDVVLIYTADKNLKEKNLFSDSQAQVTEFEMGFVISNYAYK